VACLAALAARVEGQAPGSSPWLTAIDVAVGLGFVIAASLAPGALRERGLLAAVGVLWLIGSLVPEARLAHQGALAITLTAFPSGRPSGVVRWLLVGLAVPVALGFVPQPGVAGLFAAIGVTALVGPQAWAAARYSAGSAIGVALVLGGSWWVSRMDAIAFDPSLALLLYQVTLLVVACTFPLAARAVIASRTLIADQILGDSAPAGLEGLEAVLADALRDPSLRVHRGRGRELGFAIDNDSGSEVAATQRRWLEVTDGMSRVAVIEHRSAALDDPTTAEAVASAVRLAAQRLQLEENLRAHLIELEAARARFVAAADRQREATAQQLRQDVVTPLRRATSDLEGALLELDDGEAAGAIEVVVRELDAAADDVVGLVAGLSPTRLVQGRLGDAILALAERSGVPVTVTAELTESADAETETTLYYVCSEALTNAVKHAAARRIEIVIGGDEHRITLTVSDDGCGGADVSGSGLQGLADRLATRGGRLRVDSPPGAGTILTATVPR
jgi:signal transduction histidine kinase